MAIAKKKPAGKAAAATKSDSTEQAAITVTRIFTEEGELNTDGTETLEVVALPAGAPIGRMDITRGVAAEYSRLKAGVTISVPYVLGEEAAAAAYANAKVSEILDEIGADIAEAAEAEPEPEEKKPAKKGGKKSSKKEEEEPEEEEDDDADGEGEGEEGDEESVTEEDINAMNRDQLIDFITQYGEEAEEEGEDNPFEDFDADDYKKNKAGLAELKEYVIGTLFAGYTEEELNDMDEDDLKEVFAEAVGGKWKNKKAAIKAILAAQEAEDEE